MSNTKPCALITGGSSGIGLELSRLFARDGWNLILVAKPPDELDAAAESIRRDFPGTEVRTLQIDLCKPESAGLTHAQAKKEGWNVNVLVNNAGFGTYGFIDEIDLERDIDMIHLHVLTLYRLTRLFLHDMLEQGQGTIVNLSSISAYQPNPYLATYGATKSFVLQFSRAIDEELRMRKSPVRVMAVCPTPVKNTGFQHAAGMTRTNTFSNWMVVTPQVVALDIYRGIKKRKSLVIPGTGFNLLHKLVHRLPSAWVIRLSKQYLREK